MMGSLDLSVAGRPFRPGIILSVSLTLGMGPCSEVRKKGGPGLPQGVLIILKVRGYWPKSKTKIGLCGLLDPYFFSSKTVEIAGKLTLNQRVPGSSLGAPTTQSYETRN